MPSVKELQDIASQVRRDIIRMTNGAASGHPGGSLGCADFLTALYFETMNHRPQFHMDAENEDVFFLSNGHICPVWYSVLAHSGYFDKTELGTFRKLHTRLQGHPTTAEHLPGVRVASGSLGQGLSVALGTALTKKLNGDTHLVYTLHGDGELQEGQIWEAAMFAAQHKVDNLIATVDWNGLQIDGANDDVISLGDLPGKWRTFGWDVLLMNGNDMEEVLQVLAEAKSKTGQGKPIVILMKTVMGKGVDFMENDHGWHGVPPTNEQAEKALAQLEETLGDY
jgi:transketolase